MSSRTVFSISPQVNLFSGDGATKGAVTTKSGHMVDLPHLRRAEKVLARAAACENASPSTSEDKKTAPDYPPPPPRVYHGKFLEDLNPGDTIHHALTRTVTEADNVLFTTMSLNPAPIHLDHDFCKKSGQFGGKPLFNSMFTLALVVGMSVLETTHGTTIANLGFSKVVFPKPVFCGDSLRAVTRVLEKRESASRPTQGIVTLEHTMFNQHDEVVCVCVRQALMKKKPAEAAVARL